MASITPEILQKISQTSGRAMKVRIHDVTVDDIREALGSVSHRVMDAREIRALDDRVATIVTGCDQMSHTEFVCFVSRMDDLIFRNILIFPTKSWSEPEEGEIRFWDRMGTIMQSKFCNRTQAITMENK